MLIYRVKEGETLQENEKPYRGTRSPTGEGETFSRTILCLSPAGGAALPFSTLLW